jgi:NAD(P)-dependent dehydrogenase (short-subunit alcohol dehydrogenase family)
MAEKSTTKKPPTSRVALVTGGASGIGLATAELLLESGWKVAIADLPGAVTAKVRAAHVQSRSAKSKSVCVYDLNVTDEPAVEALVAEIESDFGPIHGVVNSAGIAADVPIFETTVAMFRNILDINVVGSFIVGRAAARRMATRKHGAIVNVASISGLRGSKGRSAYGASKGAVVTLTQVMANDLASYGIRVNAVAPGATETPMVQALHTAKDRELFGRFIPMARYGEPSEIATAIEFLLDDTRASYITGEILAVDGGYRGAGLIVRD